ncbi:hypothetical protein SHIRM173S_01659 [Streptomyces hirsutus]
MMSVEASGKAIADAGIEAGQIGAVVVLTVSHFQQTPAIATEIADRLGTNKAAAFDISRAAPVSATASPSPRAWWWKVPPHTCSSSAWSG